MKKNTGKNNSNSKSTKTPLKEGTIIMIDHSNEFCSPKFREMSIEAEKLRNAEKLDEVKAALRSIQRIQRSQPLEVRLEAYNLTIAAARGNMVRKAASSIVAESAANPLAHSVILDIHTLQSELESGLTVLGSVSSTPQETKTLMADIDSLRSIRNQTTYRSQLSQIKSHLHKGSVKNHIIKLHLAEILTDLLIDLVIPDYLQEHPEDDVTSFCFSIYQALSGLSGPDAYAPISFLSIDIDNASVKLLLPNRLNEESLPKHFLISARAIHEVSDSLPYAAVQDLVEQLMVALRDCLNKCLQDLVDDGEITFHPWDRRQMELLYEVKEAVVNTNPENLEDFFSEMQLVLEMLEKSKGSISSLSASAYALLLALLRDKTILNMAYAIDKTWELSDFVRKILPLYISMLCSIARGRNDFWNDPVFLLWESSM